MQIQTEQIASPPTKQTKDSNNRILQSGEYISTNPQPKNKANRTRSATEARRDEACDGGRWHLRSEVREACDGAHYFLGLKLEKNPDLRQAGRWIPTASSRRWS